MPAFQADFPATSESILVITCPPDTQEHRIWLDIQDQDTGAGDICQSRRLGRVQGPVWWPSPRQARSPAGRSDASVAYTLLFPTGAGPCVCHAKARGTRGPVQREGERQP